MKINKTDVLSFDELARFHGLSLMKWDEDNYASENTQLANDFFEVGQKSKQAEIDELQKNFNNALKTIEIQQRFLDDADAAKEHIDSLQKRIEDALKELEYIHFYKTQNSDNAIKILKGEETK